MLYAEPTSESVKVWKQQTDMYFEPTSENVKMKQCVKSKIHLYFDPKSESVKITYIGPQKWKCKITNILTQQIQIVKV